VERRFSLSRRLFVPKLFPGLVDFMFSEIIAARALIAAGTRGDKAAGNQIPEKSVEFATNRSGSG
jgi:hypothetical protein